MTTQTQGFKVGDRVVCVDDSASFRRLRAGDLYTVEGNYDGSPTVMVNGASHSLERFRLASPAPAGWEVAEAGSKDLLTPRDFQADALEEYGCGLHAEATDSTLLLACFEADCADDAFAAALVDAAPGPGSVRPFEHPRLPEVMVFLDCVPFNLQEHGFGASVTARGLDGHWLALAPRQVPLSGSVGPFPVEPLAPSCSRCGRMRGLVDGLCDDCTIALHGRLLPWLEPVPAEPTPGLSAAQRRLVGEGWEVVAVRPEHVYMISPGGVSMWVAPDGRKSFSEPTPARDWMPDDGAAARQTREARADRFEDVDGRVQGVDRG